MECNSILVIIKKFMLIPRILQSKIVQMAAKWPVISITGPRQSGKTTLAKMCFPNYSYVNLENPETLLRFKEDPQSALSHQTDGLIIDEAQRFPELFSWIQVIVDEKKEMGMFILSGS